MFCIIIISKKNLLFDIALFFVIVYMGAHMQGRAKLEVFPASATFTMAPLN